MTKTMCPFPEDGSIRQQVTLLDAMNMMGDDDKRISILKVDVEGMEIPLIRNWISDGLTDRIDQIQIEFHTGDKVIKKSEMVDTLTELMDDLRDLYRRGFRSISYEPNLFAGKGYDYGKNKYYSLFDIVLYKIRN